jgi:hypothetical protein
MSLCSFVSESYLTAASGLAVTRDRRSQARTSVATAKTAVQRALGARCVVARPVEVDMALGRSNLDLVRWGGTLRRSRDRARDRLNARPSASNQGNDAYRDTTLSVALKPCSTSATLVVTSGNVVGPDDTECGYRADQLCVAVFAAENVGFKASVSHLDKGDTWYGLTRASIDAALQDKHDQLFSLNCTPSPCATVWVMTYVDGQLRDQGPLAP